MGFPLTSVTVLKIFPGAGWIFPWSVKRPLKKEKKEKKITPYGLMHLNRVMCLGVMKWGFEKQSLQLNFTP